MFAFDQTEAKILASFYFIQHFVIKKFSFLCKKILKGLFLMFFYERVVTIKCHV